MARKSLLLSQLARKNINVESWLREKSLKGHNNYKSILAHIQGELWCVVEGACGGVRCITVPVKPASIKCACKLRRTLAKTAEA